MIRCVGVCSAHLFLLDTDPQKLTLFLFLAEVVRIIVRCHRMAEKLATVS